MFLTVPDFYWTPLHEIPSLDPEGLQSIVLFSEAVLSLFFLEISSST